jgi:hypothetical protein
MRCLDSCDVAVCLDFRLVVFAMLPFSNFVLAHFFVLVSTLQKANRASPDFRLVSRETCPSFASAAATHGHVALVKIQQKFV